MENNRDQWVDDRMASLESGEQPNTEAALARLQRRRIDRTTSQRRWGFLAAAALVTSVTVMAFPTPRAFAQRCVDACASESSRIGQLLALRFWSGNGTAANPADRKVAPDFALTDVDGRVVRLSDLKGKVVLLNFWATWCAPCRIEIPWFTEFQRTYRGKGLVVVGVSLDDDGWKSVKPFVVDTKINYPVVIGNEEVDKAFGGVSSLPETLIIDREGRIAVVHTGLCNRGEYQADIERVLSE
jgi:peroxiredoxin